MWTIKQRIHFGFFAIGGSTTEQKYIDDERTWTNRLQESLQKEHRIEVEVINTGVSGLRADHHLATLHHILDMNPDAVIFVVGINDWNHHIRRHFDNRSKLERATATVRKFTKQIALKNTLLGNAISRVRAISKTKAQKQAKIQVREDHGEYYTRQRRSLERPLKYSYRPQRVMPEYANRLDEISELCHQHKIQCAFITQPSGYQKAASSEFKAGFWMTPPNEIYTLDFDSMVHISTLYNKYLKKFAAKRGHLLCDAADKLSPNYESFYDDCHFNVVGAAKMGEVVSKCFQDMVDH